MARSGRFDADPLESFDPRWYARLFDRLGARYEEYPFTRGAAQEIEFLVDTLGLSAGDRVLDVGCGTARHSIELAARGLQVTGVDLAARLLELGLQAARRRDVVVNLVHEDARDLGYDAFFDATISLCEGAFGLLEDDLQNSRVLERMRAALKPGGRLALNALNRAFIEARRDHFPGFDPATGWTMSQESMTLESGLTLEVCYRDRSFGAAELSDFVASHGFRVDAVWGSSPGDFGIHPVDAERPELLLIAVRV